eukprot:9503796-Pyramimonas_sp.AAC.2
MGTHDHTRIEPPVLGGWPSSGRDRQSPTLRSGPTARPTHSGAHQRQALGRPEVAVDADPGVRGRHGVQQKVLAGSAPDEVVDGQVDLLHTGRVTAVLRRRPGKAEEGQPGPRQQRGVSPGPLVDERDPMESVPGHGDAISRKIELLDVVLQRTVPRLKALGTGDAAAQEAHHISIGGLISPPCDRRHRQLLEESRLFSSMLPKSLATTAVTSLHFGESAGCPAPRPGRRRPRSGSPAPSRARPAAGGLGAPVRLRGTGRPCLRPGGARPPTRAPRAARRLGRRRWAGRHPQAPGPQPDKELEGKPRHTKSANANRCPQRRPSLVV